MSTPLRIANPHAPESVRDNLWDFDLANTEHTATLRLMLLHRPDAHPAWHSYALSLVHLRAEPEYPLPKLHHQDSTHELVVFALDPNSNPDLHDYRSIKPLTPPNLIYQLRGLDDTQALEAFSLFVAGLSAGHYSPDTDHKTMHECVLAAANTAVRSQH